MIAAVLAAVLASAFAMAADKPADSRIPLLAAPDAALPIDLDAAFSELDRRNNRLIFRQLNITQGDLSIKADEASADPADFENSLWTFSGNVRIRNGATTADCDTAELTFRGNRLRKAALRGQPARFTQAGTAGKPPTTGRGQLLVYDLVASTIELTTDAYLSDNRNEITGNRIAYDLRREVVTAGAASGGQVRMRITPQKEPVPPVDDQ